MKEKLDWLKGQLQPKALLRSVTTEGGTRFVIIIGTNSWPASHAENWDFIVGICMNTPQLILYTIMQMESLLWKRVENLVNFFIVGFHVLDMRPTFRIVTLLLVTSLLLHLLE